MKPGAHIVAAAAARFYAPLIALFALLLLAYASAGGGVGFSAGLAFALVLLLHALVFGAAAARKALPIPLARVLLAAGAMATMASAGLSGFAYVAQLSEAGLFVATVASAALIIQAIFARAPTLRDEHL
jgi:multisubunit Na+/H+ antiporter MnhB subunit